VKSYSDRQSRLYDALGERILVLDGAMGTMLQQRALTAADFGGADLEGCNENLVRTRPDVVLDIHRAYFEAGADIVETDTFGGTPIVLAEYDLAGAAFDLNREAARLARQAAEEFSSDARPRFVAGSMGPTTKAITVTGGVTFDQLREAFHAQARALMEGGADILLLETCQDTRNVKAAIAAIHMVEGELGVRIPLMISCTIEPTGTMLAGQAADAFWVSVAHAAPLSIGLNCATGPEFMTDHLRALHELAASRISCYPNAGLPDEEGRYRETPETLSRQLERFAANGWLNIVGGCCGTTPAHIRAIARMVEGRAPRRAPEPSRRAFYSGIELVEAEDSTRPLLVGERTNVIGSRLFKDLVAREAWEESSEIARRQVRNGAQIVDVCLQSSDRDELEDVPPFYERLIRKIKAPVMIDTTDPRALELALTYCQGKSIINSVNLEDGEEKFALVAPLARAYGAALVVGCIDEDPQQAQAFTRERKLEVAERSVRLLTGKYGVPVEDIVIDPLVFPCATGDENYIGGAIETVEAVRLIKERLPHVRTLLGVSNVSFGLPAAAREAVNSVFLYHATRAGLDLAIVNAEKIERFASLAPVARLLAENLLFQASVDGVDAPADWREQTRQQRAAVNQFHIAAIAEYFRKAAPKAARKAAELPLDERLSLYIVEGTRDGLIADLDLKLKEGAPALEIVNGPLMSGMNEVGRLFNANELIVAEVLQSAEAMKASVAYLEPFMGKSESASRGKIVLATVKGDVHDIGKNLVEIILANNGYRVINLGIKVPPERLIGAAAEHSPDAIGLSGLLVKSAQQMVVTAGDLRQAGVNVPLLVGGAALSEKFTRGKIATAYDGPTFYAKDAMTGLRLLNQIMDPSTRASMLEAPAPAEAATVEAAAPRGAAPSEVRSSRVRTDIPIPPAPYLECKTRDVPQLAEIWSYINPYMLYGRHLGFRGNFEELLSARDAKALDLFHQVEEVKGEAAAFMKVRAVWQFFEARREGNSVRLADYTFHFARQAAPGGLCLSDYVLDPLDHMAVFVVTAGEGVRERAEEAKASGRFFFTHALQALAIETAEAAAEWLHRRIREDWGFPDPPSMTMRERFTARYRGKRYSLGYGACPNLDDQQGIWKLLDADRIGVRLTEGMMMDPEASVSALVFHHPDCTYFNAAG
jgi:5-methyltetrahydrofolate--homocysteine methyltransferase